MRARATAYLQDRPRAAAAALAWLSVAVVLALVLSPWWEDLSSFGFHDWDVQTAHRYLAVKSLLRYHEFPGWNPFACGGFPAWGFVEADTVLVSPFLPAYLVLPLSLALRVEVLGMALLGAWGAWACASRFTTSRAAQALVVVLWAVNGRWALQTAAGHTWHLAYAYLPWCLYFFERARLAEWRVRDLALGSLAIAMLVYAGGIYPLPHTVLILGLYAVLLALLERSVRPVAMLAAMGSFGLLLSAPKLLPLLDGFHKVPRLIESPEAMDLFTFIALLMSRHQGFYAMPWRQPYYGWHEWGMYIGVAGTLVLLVGAFKVRGRRNIALLLVGALLLVLGLGAFAPWAPWTLLHTYLPVFRSHHVPARFLYPAVLLLGLVAAASAGRFIARRSARVPYADALAALAVLAMAVDIGLVARQPMTESMWMVPPDHIPTGTAFHFAQSPPFQYKRHDAFRPMYPAMLGNTGVIKCYGAPPLDHIGARAVTAPDYHGEAYVVLPDGQSSAASAHISAWSPNHAVIEVDQAEAGAWLVYNMNYDEGWRADTGPVLSLRDAVATPLRAGRSTVTLRYHPPHLHKGLLAAALGGAGLLWLKRRESRARTKATVRLAT